MVARVCKIFDYPDNCGKVVNYMGKKKKPAPTWGDIVVDQIFGPFPKKKKKK